jgi:hypothetical protein
MSRLRISAFLLIALCAVGCSSKDNGGQSSTSDSDDDDNGDGTGGRRDAGRDARANTNPDGGRTSDARVVQPPPDIDKNMTPFERDDTGQSGLSGGDIEDLKAGGEDCAEGSVLYPYDGTVFPVGLAPPQIMFREPNDGAYLKLTYQAVDNIKYEVAVAGAEPSELLIPQDAWNEVLRRTSGQPLFADISFKKGGSVQTCHFKWRAAQGALTGQVFYNTYNHPDLGGQGAVMRLPLDALESEVYLKYTGLPGGPAGPCVSCHSVSFNGEQMAASTHSYNPFGQSFETNSYAIVTEPQPPVQSKLPESTFAAFTPAGDKMLAMGNPQCTAGANAFPRAPNNFMLLQGPTVAAIHDTKTGEVLPAQGLNKDWYMWMPQFSPDGTKVVFNHAKPDGKGGTDRRELAIMDFDNETNTFSNLKVIASKMGPEPSILYQPLPTLSFPGIAGDCSPATPSDVAAIPQGTCEGPCYPGWPFFTPDNSAVVFVLGSEPDFAAAFPGRDNPSKSELWYVDIASGKSVKLANAGEGPRPEDGVQNYYPTMLPVTVGGYYWLFWSSMRDWGFRDTNPSPGQVASNFFGGTAVLTATRKRIWVSAIRPPKAQEGFIEDVVDFSSKPFYLEGQSNSGNIRAFAALNPCRPEGQECRSGIDCCTGFCDIKDGESVGSCVPPRTCANRGERCDDKIPCCEAAEGKSGLTCIGGYCDVIIQ